MFATVAGDTDVVCDCDAVLRGWKAAETDQHCARSSPNSPSCRRSSSRLLSAGCSHPHPQTRRWAGLCK